MPSYAQRPLVVDYTRLLNPARAQTTPYPEISFRLLLKSHITHYSDTLVNILNKSTLNQLHMLKVTRYFLFRFILPVYFSFFFLSYCAYLMTYVCATNEQHAHIPIHTHTQTADGDNSNTYSVVAAKRMTTTTTATTTSNSRSMQKRDHFHSTTLGIPDVSTHVGSVVHAFETLAANSPPASLLAAERPYEIYSTDSFVQSVKSFDRSLGTQFLNPVTLRNNSAQRQVKPSHGKTHAAPPPPAPPTRNQRGQRPISTNDDYRRSFSPPGSIIPAVDGEWYLQAPPSASTDTFIRRPAAAQDVFYQVRTSRPASHHSTALADTGLTHYGSRNHYEDDPTLLRGTTVSQSFIKNISNHKPREGNSKRNPNAVHVAGSSSGTSNGFRRSVAANRSQPASEFSYTSGNQRVAKNIGGSQLLALSRSSGKRQSFRPRTSHRAII